MGVADVDYVAAVTSLHGMCGKIKRVGRWLDVHEGTREVGSMASITIEEAQLHLSELIDQLVPGQEMLVTRNDQPVAKLTRAPLQSWPCKAGSAKDKILWIAPDFDAPLDDFREYME